jgi:hypothetical protein
MTHHVCWAEGDVPSAADNVPSSELNRNVSPLKDPATLLKTTPEPRRKSTAGLRGDRQGQVGEQLETTGMANIRNYARTVERAASDLANRKARRNHSSPFLSRVGDRDSLVCVYRAG